jgi:DNA topoisomerase II
MNYEISKKYQKLTQIEHILKRPGMYIGSIENKSEKMWILENNNIKEKEIIYSPGLYKIFDEIIMNAYDETTRDNTLKNIKISFKNNEITIFNDGKGIEIVIHPKYKIYIPELIFGNLLTSSTYNDNSRLTAGVHGLGAKLTAIFSKKFTIEIGDPKNKKHYKQTFENNLAKKYKPIIKEYEKKDGFVKISFIPDFKRFNVENLSDDMISLMSRRAYDISSILGKNVNVYINNIKININSFDSYVNLFLDKRDKVIEDNIEDKEDIITISETCSNRWKIVITSSLDEKYRQISFVNGIYTSNGGRHVDYIVNQIINNLQKVIKKKYKNSNVKDSFIKDRFWIFISAIIENSSFSSQTKEELITPVKEFGSQCIISDKFMKNIIKKLNISNDIISYIKSKQAKELEKMDKKRKQKTVKIKKLYDANYAGTSKSELCTLILTEGDSAKAMAISGLSAIKNGTDIFGVFPLKGKLLNVREASHKQIINNDEFNNIRKILGLKMGTIYSKENINQLRYGSILLMMDADVDGSHIKGLFFNMIEYFWPSLLRINNYLKALITPVVKVSNKKNKKNISFYTLTDYNDWKNNNYSKDWHIKYYKGLGTNTSKEAKEYFHDLENNTTIFKWDNKLSNKALILAFSKKQADNRKLWLKKYNKKIILDYSKNIITYDEFVNKELIHFSNYDNIRSIPNMCDGLKPSQRKVLYSCFKRNLINDIKVSQLIGYISENSAYHHGEMSLTNTVIGMAQNFLGSNNINLLQPNGQFGTRLMGGKDSSSARYIFTQLSKITRNIFLKDDDILYNYLNDDGFSIEPEYYIPSIPFILVNGSEGIGTGYSTFIPKFNPKDIIENLINKLNEKSFKRMIPWYKNFKGDILKLDNSTFISKGKYRIENEKKLIIYELPIGLWTDDYKLFLDNLIEKEKWIRKYKNNSTESSIYFEITISNDSLIYVKNLENNLDEKKINGVEKILKLTKYINLSNMYLYNSKSIITKYKNEVDILKDFYEIRLEYYQKRKDYLLKKLKDELEIIRSKTKFISSIITKKINIFNKEKSKIIKILDNLKLKKIKNDDNDNPYDYLIKMSFYSITKEKIDELNKILIKKKKDFKIINDKTNKQLWLDDLIKIKEKLNV